MIPFRHEVSDKYSSDYVVRLVEDECSCFPTRKRVPYRIIIETIDIKELQNKHPDEKFKQPVKVDAEPDRDLFTEVS